MMSQRLSTQIGALLQQEGAAIVPGLGGFILEVLPAYYDRVKQLAYPPRTELHFNEALTYQDGLLEARYASVYGVSIRRGRLMLEEDVRSLRTTLLSTQEYRLQGLGRLIHNGRGQVSFLPEVSINLAGDAYGLVPTSLPLAPSGLAHQNSNDPRYLYLRLSKRWVGAAAVVVAIALALYPFSSIQEQRTHFSASLIPSELTTTRLWTEEAKTPATELEKPVQSAELIAPATTGESNIAQPNDQQYYIVIGAERKLERAETFVANVRASTPEATILHTGKMYRIVVGRFSSMQQAYQFKNTFVADHPKHKDAWVFHNK